MATRGPVSTIQRSDIVPLRQRPQLGDGRCRRPLRALRLVNVLALLMRTARGQRPPRTWRTAPKGLADDHAIVKYTLFQCPSKGEAAAPHVDAPGSAIYFHLQPIKSETPAHSAVNAHAHTRTCTHTYTNTYTHTKDILVTHTNIRQIYTDMAACLA